MQVRVQPQVRRATALIATLAMVLALASGCSSDDGSDTTTTSRAEPVLDAAAAPVGGPLTVAAGGAFSCGRDADGAAWCWGINSTGALGTTGPERSATPVAVTGLDSGVQSVAAGAAQACAVLDDGTARCWGRNTDGTLGDGTTTSGSKPVTVSGLTDIVQIATATSHSCAITEAGAASCWGRAGSGQLGDGTKKDALAPVAVSGIDAGATAISTGTNHTCAAVDGTARCWGNNAQGQLGDGTRTNAAAPVTVTDLTGVVEVAAGDGFSCALTDGGAVWCWGNNASGQLGDGTTTRSLSPVAVEGLGTGAAGISAGKDLACARLADGTARCWGANATGQLGDGTTDSSPTPRPVAELDDVISISAGAAAGGGHACAVTADGVAHCWGSNEAGQLGNETSVLATTPTAVEGAGRSATAASSSTGGSCAITEDGGAVCWGANDKGQLGTGTTGSSSTPVDVKGLDQGVTSISAGAPQGTSRCAVQDGAVWCWGTSTGGLGDGTTNPSATPVQVQGITDARSVSVGGSHACAVTGDTKVWCWGYNASGQLGDGTTTLRTAPVQVKELDDVLTISAGTISTCAATRAGTVSCWGSVPGAKPSSTPVAIAGLERVARIATGASSACAVEESGQVLCWGANAAGQLGTGTRAASATPVAVGGVTPASSVAVGALHACAVLDDGTARCWGQGIAGQLGDGTAKNSLTPVTVGEFDGPATEISAGTDHTCATTDAGISCWGSDVQGQIGIAPPTATPTEVGGGHDFS